MVVLALSGLVINQLCFTAGLDRTNAINATIIVATIPVLTAAYAVLSGREHGSAKLWIGLGAALLGAILVADPRRLALSGGHLQGNLLLLANSALYSVFLVEARAWIGRYGPQCVLVWVFAIGAVFITPIGIPAVAAHAASWDLRLWIAIAYIVLFATAFAYAANTWALRHLPSSFVALFIYAQPLLAIAMAVSLGESLAQWLRLPASTESITANTMIGTAAIFFGIYIATRTNRSRRELDHAT
jgi:drug/metabolite transporter (DMT)-like permease